MQPTQKEAFSDCMWPVVLRGRALSVGVGLTLVSLSGQLLPAQEQQMVERIRPEDAPKLTLEEVIGELDGQLAFGRIVGVTTDRSGKIYVVDEANRHVKVVSSTGTVEAVIGRQGRGPGEFEAPSSATVDATDSLFVWDSALGRLSVFDPDHRYVRSATLPVSWNVNSLSVLASGELMFAAFSAGERHGLHIVSRTGNIDRSFADVSIPVGVSAFFDSVLGGTAATASGNIVYLRKSPYVVDIYSPAGTLHRSCVGQSEWTTRPQDVIEVSATRMGLRWGRYRHASELAVLPSGLFLTVIAELGKPERIVMVVGTDCAIHYRGAWPADQVLAHHREERLYTFSNEEVPQVLVYRIR